MASSNVFRAFVALSLASLSMACFAAHAETLARNVSIANEGAIASDWRVADGARIVAPAYPAEYDSEARPDACIAMQYTIFPDGTTGDFRVVRHWKSGPVANGPLHPFWVKFARAGVAAVGQWRFAPRDATQVRPVTTVATLSFHGATVADAAQLRAHCRITDLGVLVRNIERGDRILANDVEREYQLHNRRFRLSAAAR